jgi:hypothetical protein
LPDLIAQARALPQTVRNAAALDGLIHAIQQHTPLPPVSFTPSDVRQLSQVAFLAPIPDLQTLTQRFAVALETPQSPLEIEILFDAVSRLVPGNADKSRKLFKPLGKRIFKSGFFRIPGNLFYFGTRLCEMLAIPCPHSGGGGFRFLSGWLTLITHRVDTTILPNLKSGLSLPTLGHPTHAPGWIDPLILVDRLAQYERANAPIDPTDLSLALLRLAFENRPAALAAAKSLTSPLAAALRHALGQPQSIPQSIPHDTPHWPLWAAASRAAHPHTQDPAIPSQWLTLGPDIAGPVHITLHHEKRSSLGYEYILTNLKHSGPLIHPDSLSTDYPAWATHRAFTSPPDIVGHYGGRELMPGDLQGIPTLWPAMPDRFDAMAAAFYGSRLDKKTREAEAQLTPILATWQFRPRPLSPLGWFVLVGALGHPLASINLIANDTVIQAIADGKTTGPELATAAHHVLTFQSSHLSRIASAFNQISRASLLHAHVIAAAIDTFITTLPPQTDPPQGTLNLLTSLRELQAQGVHTLSAPATATLQSWAKTKSGKLASESKALTKKKNPNPAIRSQIHTLALQSRLAFAQSL